MKILLIRLSSLGDVVLATAAVEALREDRPDAEVHVLTKPAFREVFRGNPGVAEVLGWDPGAGVFGLSQAVRSRRYDRVVDLHGNLRTAILQALAPGVRWSRYCKGAWRRRLAVWLRRPGLLPGDHVVDRYLAALGPLGVAPRRRLPKLYPTEPDRARAGQLLGQAGWKKESIPVALAPGARWPTKAWPADFWGELIGEMPPEWFPVALGGPGEADLAAIILAGRPGANLAGRTSILETAAVLERCGALVTNDSASLHVAGAVGTPVVALFGPTVRGFGFHPLGPRDVVLEEELSCRPCSLHGGERCPLGHHRCLAGIEPGRVGEAVGRVLRAPGASAGGEGRP